jgi:hypothetical protein
MVGWHEEGQDLDRLTTHEAALGKRFALVRLYHQWRVPGRLLDRVVSEGRLAVSSHKPPDPVRGGWQAVASGSEDATIRALARRYRSLDAETVFVFLTNRTTTPAISPVGVPTGPPGSSGRPFAGSTESSPKSRRM